MSGEDNNAHHIPDLEAKHNSRSKREPNECPYLLKGGPWKSLPTILTPTNDLHKLRNCSAPTRKIIRCGCPRRSPSKYINKKPTDENLQDYCKESDPCKHRNFALSLKKLLSRKCDRKREQLRNDHQCVYSRQIRNFITLSEDLEDWGCKYVEWQIELSWELYVNTKHMNFSCTKCLPT